MTDRLGMKALRTKNPPISLKRLVAQMEQQQLYVTFVGIDCRIPIKSPLKLLPIDQTGEWA
jgi:hypothetical protein